MSTILYWTDAGTGSFSLLEFDTTTSLEPVDTVTITDHPVEQGADITDHVRKDPEAITIEAYVTNTPHHGNLGPDDDHVLTTIPLRVPTIGPRGTANLSLTVAQPPIGLSVSGLVTAGLNAITDAAHIIATAQTDGLPRTQPASARGLQSPTKRDRARIAYEALLAAQGTAALISVSVEGRQYFDMISQRIARPRATGDGTAFKFQIDLRKIRIAGSRAVESPKPAEARGAATVSSGTQATKPDPNADAKGKIQESWGHLATGDVSGQ